MHFTGAHGIDLNASYVRSQARADLNAFTTFFDSMLWPVVGRNEYAPARTDTPHRLLVRGRAMPTPRWLFVGVLDWRSGVPYSVVNEALDFVGPRNDRRFPDLPARRPRGRAPVQDPEHPAVDWRARRQCAQLVPAIRRAGEHLLAGVRLLLQLRVPAVPHPGAVRALNDRDTGPPTSQRAHRAPRASRRRHEESPGPVPANGTLDRFIRVCLEDALS